MKQRAASLCVAAIIAGGSAPAPGSAREVPESSLAERFPVTDDPVMSGLATGARLGVAIGDSDAAIPLFPATHTAGTVAFAPW